MGPRVVSELAVAMRSIPRDASSRVFLRQLLTESDSVLSVLTSLGMKLDATEKAFLEGLPPLVDGAIRGAIVNTLDPSKRTRINFDVAYRQEGSGHSLTISAPKRGEIDVVLVAPEPKRAPARGRTVASRTPARKGKAAPRKPKGSVRKRGRR